MAIDANILLQGITPDIVGSAGRGFQLGQAIRNAPLLRRQREQQLTTGEQQQNLNDQRLATGQTDAGDRLSTALFRASRGEQITADNWVSIQLSMRQQGFPVEDEELQAPTQEDLEVINRTAQAGGERLQESRGGGAAKRSFEGDFTFKDEAGNFFSQTTFTDPETQQTTAKLTDVSGREAQPQGQLTPVSTTGESAQQRRSNEANTKVQTEENIQKVKSAAIPNAERNKVIGRERGKIETSIKQGAQQSRRSKANLLRLKRGLDQVNTGRLAAAQDLIGGMIPGVRNADAEVFNSLASQFALDELSKQSGTKTDFDFKKAAETQARLGNTQEANNRIIEIALDRFDEIEQEERQFKEFLKTDGNAEDFEFVPVPPEHIDFVRAHKDDKKIVADFKSKYGYLPTGL